MLVPHAIVGAISRSKWSVVLHQRGEDTAIPRHGRLGRREWEQDTL